MVPALFGISGVAPDGVTTQARVAAEIIIAKAIAVRISFGSVRMGVRGLALPCLAFES